MLEYDPFSEQVREDPLPVYRRLREEDPVHYMPRYDAWALSRFQDIWDASNDPESFSAARGTTPAQLLTKDQPVEPMLNVMDPPQHTQLRSAIRRCFLPNHVRSLEPEARKLAVELLEAKLPSGELDVVQDFAARLSVTVACMATGLPVEDGPYLTRLVQGFFAHDPADEGMAEAGLAQLAELRGYCRDKILERRRGAARAADALQALVDIEIDGQRFSDDDAGSHLAMLVIGGSETFPKVLANGVRRLWEHPDQRADLVADPALCPDAFNEILRFDMPTQFLGRTLRKDVELHGKTLRAGQPVIFLFASANRDDREFTLPDRFDIRRRAPRMLSFGAGTHQCLGTHVARMEGRVCLEELLGRVPEYEVDLQGAERLRTEFVQGYASLSIHFQA